MRARLISRELRGRPGRVVWLLVAAAVAVTFSVAAFGFSSQVSGLLTGASVDASAFLPEGSITVTADSSSVTTATALDEALLDQIRAVEGVASAEGSYDQPVQLIIPGDWQPERPVALRGVVLSSEYSPDRWRVVEGEMESNTFAVALDANAAAIGRVGVGDFVRVGTPSGSHYLPVNAIVEAVAVDGAESVVANGNAVAIALSSAHVVFHPDSIEGLLATNGKVDRVVVLPLPGVDLEDLEARLDDTLSDGLRLTPATDRAAATQQTVQRLDESIQQAVTGVAVLSVLISALVIMNTLMVLVAQRTQEFGLLRALGASRGQLIRSVIGQSVSIGIVGAAIGIGLGTVLAAYATDVARPTAGPLTYELTPTMVIAGVAIGVVVTALGAVAPAMRAGRIAPMEAISEARGGADRATAPWQPLLSLCVGGALAAAPWLADLDTGSMTSRALQGLGAVGIIAGIARLTRWVVGPITAIPGAIAAALSGVIGRLARANVKFRPSRSSAAGSALLVGLVLVGTVATVGASVRETVADAFDTASTADRYLERRGVVRISPDALRGTLDSYLGDRGTAVLLSSFDGSIVGPSGARSTGLVTDANALASFADLDVIEGSIPALGEVGLSDATATRLGVGIGDDVTLRTFSGSTSPSEVTAIYRNTTIAGPAIVHLTGELASTLSGTFELGLVELHERGAGQALRETAESFPLLRSMRPAQFDELNTAVTDTVLRIITIVLTGMVGIGYLGLVATLGLSTLERRHELRVLRSVGALRGQVRSMVLFEAMLIAIVSAVVGLGAGTAIGAASIRFLPDDLADQVVVPWGLLVLIGAASVAIAAFVVMGVSRRAANARLA